MKRNFTVILLFNFIILHNYTFAQKIEWANKVIEVKNLDYEFENNGIDLALGPPTEFTDHMISKEQHDMYVDGYLIFPIKNKKFTASFSFKKPIIADKLILGGVFNEGVIKKINLILKDNKLKSVAFKEKNYNGKKFIDFLIEYPTETVYGVKLTLDHSKADDWNLLKGIGVCKSSSIINLDPDFYEGDLTKVEKTKVESINSKKCAELNPRISLDGSKLYFVRDCGDKKQEQIWVSDGANDQWNLPKELPAPLNNNGHNYVVSTAYDLNTIYLGNIYKSNGEEQGAGLSVSNFDKETNSWKLPTKVELPYVINNSEYENYFVSPDQHAIIISMEKEEGFGGLDLYVSLYNKYKKAFDEPINLGAEINTEFDEDFPYLSFDNHTLFYCSKGFIGFGGHDIYITKREDNTWQKWHKPKNLGPVINTKTDDFGFTCSTSGDVAYLSSVNIEGEEHNIDIFKLSLPKNLHQISLTNLRGKIVNEKNNVPLNATITIKENAPKDPSTQVIQADEGGYFYAVLQHGKSYDISIEMPKFFKINDKIALTEESQKGTLLKNFKMTPYLDSGEVAIIQNIQFKYSSTIFTDDSSPALEKLYKMLAEQKNMIVEIAGHTDDKGSDTFNLKLSKWRAAAVVDYLIGKGIRDWRLKIKGYGEMAPLAANDTEEGRALNRRVEMTILEDDFTKKYKKKKDKSKK